MSNKFSIEEIFRGAKAKFYRSDFVDFLIYKGMEILVNLCKFGIYLIGQNIISLMV